MQVGEQTGVRAEHIILLALLYIDYFEEKLVDVSQAVPSYLPVNVEVVVVVALPYFKRGKLPTLFLAHHPQACPFPYCLLPPL